MNNISFETTLGDRVNQMLDACTKCGKCVEVCPSVRPAGILDASQKDIISGVLEIVRAGEGPDASRKWAKSCMLSGECIKACDYGVNPRFLLAMARVSWPGPRMNFEIGDAMAWRGSTISAET